MEAEPHPPKPTNPESDESHSISEEVAETTAPLHFEGKGLDPAIEDLSDDDG